MKKTRVKIGQIIERGIVPCKKCFIPHDSKCIQVSPMMVNWMRDGHAYQQMSAEELVVYIQNQLASLMQ
jgi:hypothetical protein